MLCAWKSSLNPWQFSSLILRASHFSWLLYLSFPNLSLLMKKMGHRLNSAITAVDVLIMCSDIFDGKVFILLFLSSP